jgi:hypothetical protein
MAYRGAMGTTADQLARAALALSPDDRAAIAAQLLASLDEGADDPTLVQAGWRDELAHRAQLVVDGDRAGEDWSAARERLTTRLTGNG